VGTSVSETRCVICTYREAERKEAEKKILEAETARSYVAKMKFLREMIPKVEQNPWLLVQEEDVSVEFIEAYALAIRNSKFYLYHEAFPEPEGPEEEDDFEEEEEKKEEDKEGAGNDEKKEDLKETKAAEDKPKLQMAESPEGEIEWKLREPSAHYLPESTTVKSRESAISALQQLVNRCNELMMQLAVFAETQPAFIFKSPQQAKYLSMAARYQASLLNPAYIADSVPDPTIVDDRPLAACTGTLTDDLTKCYDHEVVFKAILNLIKSTVEKTPEVVLEIIKQFYPPEPKPAPEKKEPEPDPKAKKGKGKGKEKEKKGKDKKKDKGKGKKEEGKKEEIKEEEKKEERPPLPDIINCEFVDHLLRFATVMHPKLWQEERIKQQEEAARKAKEEAEKAAEAAKKAEEETSGEKKTKKKSRKKNKEPERQKDPRLAQLQIAPHVPVLVSAMSALKSISTSAETKEYVRGSLMWPQFVRLAEGQAVGFDEDIRVLAKEVVQAYSVAEAKAIQSGMEEAKKQNG